MLRALRLRPPPCMFTTPKPLCFGATTLSLPPQSFTATHAIAFHLRTVPFNSAVLASTVVLLGSAASEDSLADRQEMRWLRCARAARIVKLSQLSPSLLKMMQTLLYASNSIINITIGIALFTFAYAQFGMSVLGTPAGSGSGQWERCQGPKVHALSPSYVVVVVPSLFAVAR